MLKHIAYLFFISKLTLVLAPFLPYAHGLLCSLLWTDECYLTKTGLDRGRLSI